MQWFKLKNICVEYEIVGSVTEAKCYLHKKENKVELIVTDLGLPVFKGERVKNSLTGMDIVFDMWEINTTIIICYDKWPKSSKIVKVPSDIKTKKLINTYKEVINIICKIILNMIICIMKGN